MEYEGTPCQHDTAMQWETEEINQGEDAFGAALEAGTRRRIGLHD